VLGTKHFHLTGGHGGAIRVALSQAALSKLGSHASVPVAIHVMARNGVGQHASSRRTTTLHLPG